MISFLETCREATAALYTEVTSATESNEVQPQLVQRVLRHGFVFMKAIQEHRAKINDIFKQNTQSEVRYSITSYTISPLTCLLTGGPSIRDLRHILTVLREVSRGTKARSQADVGLYHVLCPGRVWPYGVPADRSR